MLISILKRAFFIAGAGMLGYAIFTITEARMMQRYETLQFDRTLALPANLRKAHVVAGGPIGKLTIPSAGISAIVLEGADDGTLKIAPGHIPGTSLPGQNGNVAIAGHRDTFFRKLETIRNGDFVRLTTLKGAYEYKIDSTEVVDPARTDLLGSTGRPTLTLVTCYPFHWIVPAPKRFIVRGHLVRSSGEGIDQTGYESYISHSVVDMWLPSGRAERTGTGAYPDLRRMRAIAPGNRGSPQRDRRNRSDETIN